ncbi:hypothetical protein ABIF39_005748 [Bradyrhizobium diazoefficiens]
MIDLEGTSGSIGSADVVAGDCCTREAAAALCGGGLDGSFAASFTVSLVGSFACSFAAAARGLSLDGDGIETTGATLGAAGCASGAGVSCGFALCLAMAPVTESSPCSSTVTRE